MRSGLIVLATLAILNRDLAQLAVLYGSDFRLRILGPGDAMTALVFAGALGWLGAYMSVGIHLHEIQPQ